MQIVTNNKLCYSIYLPEEKILSSTFKGVVKFDLMQEHIENVLRFTQNNTVLGAIIDFSKLRGSIYKLFDHLRQEVQPTLKSRGFKIQAFVISDDLLTANITEKLVEAFQQQGSNARLFSDHETAKQWVIDAINS